MKLLFIDLLAAAIADRSILNKCNIRFNQKANQDS